MIDQDKYTRKINHLDNLYRRNNVIHYYLKKSDVLTALAEIRRGASPFVRDECNRTSLDLAIVLFMKTYQECIFTSFIIDLIYRKNKNKTSTKHIYNKNNIINHNNYRCNLNCDIKNYDDKMYYYYDNVMDRLKHLTESDIKNRKNKIKIDKLTPESLLLQQKINYFPIMINEYDSNDNNNNNEKLKKENDLLFLFDEALTLPMSKNVEAQLKDILKKMNALLFFIKTLSKDIILKKHSENILKEEISKLFIPFLYNYAIHSLFKIFRKNYQNEKWDMNNPADARRLINIILSKNLIGNQIVKFIGKSLFYFSFLVGIYGEKVFVQEPLIYQYFLHMSFVLDNEYLFNVIINKSDIFQIQDVFDWNKLIKSITPYKIKFRRYYKSLVYARLRKIFLERLEEKRKKEKKNLNNVNWKDINKNPKKNKSKNKGGSISKNTYASSNVNESNNTKINFGDSNYTVNSNASLNASAPFSTISTSYFGKDRKNMNMGAKRIIRRSTKRSERKSTQEIRPESRQENKQDDKRGSIYGSIYESRYGSEHESKHGSEHESKHGNEHESKHGNEHESKHGNEHESKRRSRYGSKRRSRDVSRQESKQDDKRGSIYGSIYGSRYGSEHESKHGSKRRSRYVSGQENRQDDKRGSIYGSRYGSEHESKHESKHGSKRRSRYVSGQESRHGSRYGSKYVSEQESKYVSGLESKYVSEQESKYVSEQESKYVSEQESKYVSGLESKYVSGLESKYASRHGSRFGSKPGSRFGSRQGTPKRSLLKTPREESVCDSNRSYVVHGISPTQNSNLGSNYRGGTPQSVQKIPRKSARKGVHNTSMGSYCRISGRANDLGKNVQGSELRRSIQESVLKTNSRRKNLRENFQKSLENSGADRRKVCFDYDRVKDNYSDYSEKSQKSMRTKKLSYSIEPDMPKNAVLDLYKNMFNSSSYHNIEDTPKRTISCSKK